MNNRKTDDLSLNELLTEIREFRLINKGCKSTITYDDVVNKITLEYEKQIELLIKIRKTENLLLPR